MEARLTLKRLFVCNIAALGFVITAPDASAQVASALLHEGDEVIPGESISSLNNTAVNHVGGYACGMNTVGTATISRIWGNPDGGAGALLISEDTYGPLEQTSFESFYGMSDEGHLAYGATVNNTDSGATGLDAVWLDDTPVLMEEDAVPSLPGQFSTFNSRPGITGDGVPWWVGGIASTKGGTTENRVLFSDVGADVVIMGGDFIPGIAEPIVTSSAGIDFDWRVSRFGSNWINQLSVASSTATDKVMVVNGDALMAGGSIVREGSPVPAAIGGLAGELWASFDYLGIREDGGYLVTGDTSADTAVDEFVMTDGMITLREGAMLDLDGTPVTVSGSIEGGYMNEQGDWAVAWDVDTPGGNIEALIFNGEIVLVEGDAVDWNGDGQIDGNDDGAVLTNFTGISTVTLGARQNGSVSIYFTADVDVNAVTLEGFFCLTLSDCPADIDGNGSVDIIDLLALIGSWGPCPGCPEDIDGSGMVDINDLLILLAAWGPCN